MSSFENKCEYVTVVGTDNDVEGKYNCVIGFGNKVRGNNCVVIGSNHIVEGDNIVIIDDNRKELYCETRRRMDETYVKIE